MFNALKYSKDLEAAGFSRQQAEATIDVFFKFMDHNFATKDDMNAMRSEIRTELSEFRTEVRTEIAELRNEIRSLEYRMTIKLGLMQTAAVALLVAILKLV